MKDSESPGGEKFFIKENEDGTYKSYRVDGFFERGSGNLNLVIEVHGLVYEINL